MIARDLSLIIYVSLLYCKRVVSWDRASSRRSLRPTIPQKFRKDLLIPYHINKKTLKIVLKNLKMVE